MKKRLSKISRELNVSIADIADFLNSNGYDCSEDPAGELSDEELELIKYNLQGYISEKYPVKKGSRQKGAQTEVSFSQDVPLELKIIDAASKEKKLIERIIGFTEFEWHYVVAKYRGKCSQPVKFGLFDEVLSEILLNEAMPLTKIGAVMGLDVERDPAEKEIIDNAIFELWKDKMIDGDENKYWLTDTGREYAKDGVKFSSFTRSFELYFDVTGDKFGNANVNAREVFSKLKSEKSNSTFSNLPTTLDAIKSLAEHQAPEIHFPRKGFQLQLAEFENATSFKAKVWVVLLENFRDNSLRTIVYDEKQNKIVDELSIALDKKDEIKSDLLSQLIKVDDEIEITEDQKSKEQIELEQQLIQKQEEIEKAIDGNEFEKIQQLRTEVLSIKRHFNSLEFEVELKRLFDETVGDLWIISPWVKKATLKRIPFFEAYLNKGGRIFVAYSEPEESGQVMAYEEPLNKLLELEKRYTHFYLHQLPAFHYKNVWLRNCNDSDLYYTGSYNILSFFVSQGLKKVRQEKMTRLDWNEEIQEEYEDVLKLFSLKYANKANDEFNLLCQNYPQVIDRHFLHKLKMFDNIKLKPFIGQGIEKFDTAYKHLEETRAEYLNLFRKKFFESAIEQFRKQATEFIKKPVSFEKKRKMQIEFEALRDEYMNFLDLQLKATGVKDLIDSLRLFKSSDRTNRPGR